MAINLNYMRRRMQLGAQPHKAKASGAVATFRTNLAAKLDSLFVDVTPVQDLHGQQYPYPAGGSKNLFGAKLSDCKTINTSGTWTGDSYAINGVTYSIDTTNDGYITSIRTSGTATATTALVLGGVEMTSGVSYAVNGCPSGGGRNKYEIMLMQRPSPGAGGVSGGDDYGDGIDYTETTTTTRGLQAVIRNGQNSNGLVFYPMVRLATVSDATFAPYSNVCPITGWAAANLSRDGVNLWNEQWELGNYNSTTGEKNPANNQIRCKDPITVTPNTAYYFNTNTNSRILYYRLDGSYIGSELKKQDTFTTPADCYFVTFHLGTSYGTTYNEDVSINHPSTDSAYHAYVGTTAVIQFGQTVYGAKIDWNGRKAVCTSGIYDATLPSWNRQGTQNNPNGTIYTVAADVPFVGWANITDKTQCLCNALVPTDTASLATSKANAFWWNTQRSAFRIIWGEPNGGSTKEQLEQFLSDNNVVFVAPLAEPFEIPLDLVDFVTVPGINNVFADCGNVDLSYWTNI